MRQLVTSPVKTGQPVLQSKPLVALTKIPLDDYQISALVIQTADRAVVSVPSQIGCAAQCSFCISSGQRPVRSLSGAEIWAVATAAARMLPPDAPFELAITGEGESTLNPNGVRHGLLLAHQSGRVSSLRVSTMGAKLKNIQMLSVAGVPVELQVSLHATADALRQKLMPAATTLAALESTLMDQAHLFFKIRLNYVLIEGMNDTDADAQRLAQFGSEHWRITLSPALGGLKPSQRTKRFASILKQSGRQVSIFNTVGAAINHGLYENLTYQVEAIDKTYQYCA